MTVTTARPAKPYKAIEKRGYWLCIDTRTGAPASYPASRASAKAEAAMLNRGYAEALAAANQEA